MIYWPLFLVLYVSLNLSSKNTGYNKQIMAKYSKINSFHLSPLDKVCCFVDKYQILQ